MQGDEDIVHALRKREDNVINITKTRAKGETIKGYEGASSGVVPIMKNLDQSFRHINQMG